MDILRVFPHLVALVAGSAPRLRGSRAAPVVRAAFRIITAGSIDVFPGKRTTARTPYQILCGRIDEGHLFVRVDFDPRNNGALVRYHTLKRFVLPPVVQRA